MSLKFLVKGQNFKLVNPIVVSGTHNYITCEAEFFGTDWEGMLKFAKFTRGSTVYVQSFANNIISKEAHLDLAKGYWDVIAYGLKVDRSVADNYDPAHAYNVGDYCLHGGWTHRCIAQTTGTWDDDDWVMDSSIITERVTTNRQILEVQSEGEGVPPFSPSTEEQVLSNAAHAYNNTITQAEATVDNNAGTPAATVTVSGSDGAKKLTFTFTNLKGKGISSIVENADRTMTITYNDGTTQTVNGVKDVYDDMSEFLEDAQTAEAARALAETGRASAETLRVNAESGRSTAETGRTIAEAGRVEAEAGRVTAEAAREASKIAGSTATVDSNVGTPSVTVTMTDHAGGGKDLNFEFKNLKGPAGSGAWGTIEGTLSDQTDLQTVLDSKVDKITGKGLSTEDYTAAEKTKLSGIEPGAEVNVQSNWSQSDSTADDYIKNKPVALSSFIDDLSSDGDPVHTHSQYLTQQSLSDYRKKSDQDVIDSNKVDKVTGKGLSTEDYTTAEKTKLSGIEANANNYTLPVASSALGGVKSGTDITVDSNGNVSVNDDSHNHIISNVDGLQTALNAKITNPSGGTAGQVLKKTASGEAWENESPGGVWGQITGTLSDQEDLNAELTSQSSAISQHTSQITATQGMISDAWNGSTTYTVGQYCIDNNALYRCKVQHTNQRPPNSTYWDAVSVGEAITELNTSASGSATFNTEYTWSNYAEMSVTKFGHICVAVLRVYRCAAGVPQNATICTVPIGFRPKNEASDMSYTTEYTSSATSRFSGVGSFRIKEDGTVVHQAGSGVVNSAYASFVYFV